MPRVCLTQKQRNNERCKKKSRALGDGIAVYKVKNKMTNIQLGSEFGVSEKAIARILAGDDVCLRSSVFWRLMDAADLEVTRNAQSF